MAPIKFSVSYTLREYLSFIHDLVPIGTATAFQRQGKTPRKVSRAIVRVIVPVVASVAFFFKKRRMPVCNFVIDEESITRDTAAGRLVLPWSRVVAVHRFSQGYVVMSAKGGMPLPYRCLAAEQRASLDALVDKRQGYSVVQWTAGGMKYSAVSDAAAAQLLALADALRAQGAS